MRRNNPWTSKTERDEFEKNLALEYYKGGINLKELATKYCLSDVVITDCIFRGALQIALDIGIISKDNILDEITTVDLESYLEHHPYLNEKQLCGILKKLHIHVVDIKKVSKSKTTLWKNQEEKKNFEIMLCIRRFHRKEKISSIAKDINRTASRTGQMIDEGARHILRECKMDLFGFNGKKIFTKDEIKEISNNTKYTYDVIKGALECYKIIVVDKMPKPSFGYDRNKILFETIVDRRSKYNVATDPHEGQFMYLINHLYDGKALDISSGKFIPVVAFFFRGVDKFSAVLKISSTQYVVGTIFIENDLVCIRKDLNRIEVDISVKEEATPGWEYEAVRLIIHDYISIHAIPTIRNIINYATAAIIGLQKPE